MRDLRRGQIYTSHDGTKLYREIVNEPWTMLSGDVMYRTNRSDQIHQCSRKTFVEWIRVRRARKTQKYRTRRL